MEQVNDINTMSFHDTSLVGLTRDWNRATILIEGYNINNDAHDIGLLIENVDYIRENGKNVKEIHLRGHDGDISRLFYDKGILRLFVLWTKKGGGTIDVSDIEVGGGDIKIYAEIKKAVS